MPPSASVLLPTLKPGPGIETVLEAIFDQQTSFDFEVLIVDSGSSESELEMIKRFPVRLSSIPKVEFGHGTTRNLLAAEAQGEALVYLTQDARPMDANWLERLVAAVADPHFGGAYSRQVPRPNADPFISFFLRQMYPETGFKVETPTWLQPGTVLFSNVGSAIRRDVWQRVPFRDVIMSEDQYWAWDALQAGYAIAYEPGARVVHSHNYSLATLFRRNWISGASLRGMVRGSARSAAAHGMSYLAREASSLWNARAAAQLPKMLAYEAVRTTAFWLGMRFGPPVTPAG